MAPRAFVCWALLLLLLCTAEAGSRRSYEDEDALLSEAEQEFIKAFPGSCRVCKFVVGRVKKLLGKDSTKEKITALLNKACNRLKIGFLIKLCNKLLNKLKDKLIDAIMNKGTPLELCQRIKLCKK